MITRRKFLSFLAIIPAAALSLVRMGRQATTANPKRFKSLESTGTWVDESGEFELRKYHDTILLDQRRKPGRYRPGRYSHMTDADRYWLLGSQWTELQQTQLKLNRHRSLILNKIVGPKVVFDPKNYGTVSISPKPKVLDLFRRKA